MDNTPQDHMRTLFGLNPGVAAHGLQFPRLPPGPMHPMASRFAVPPPPGGGGGSARGRPFPAPDLEDFERVYQDRAARLLGRGGHTGAVVPPGHPLYERHTSLRILKSENDRLLKENLELKRRLDGEAAADGGGLPPAGTRVR